MNTLELIKKLSIWEHDLQKYKECFEINKDFKNSKEADKFLITIDEFISYYQQNKEDDRRYRYALNYWVNFNEKYIKLLEDLYKAYKKKPMSKDTDL